MADLVMLVKVSSHDLFVDDLHLADLYSDDVAIPAEARVPYLISAEVVRVFKGKYISKQNGGYFGSLNQKIYYNTGNEWIDITSTLPEQKS